jgi:PAS domain S-box-containing protein
MNARRVIRTWLSALLWGLTVLLGLGGALYAEAPPTSGPWFTRDELLSNVGRDWLLAHGPVRLGIPIVPWPPFDMFSAAGEHRGISADYIALLKERMGLQISEVQFASFGEALDALRDGRIDAMPSTARTPERERFAVFTLPYIRSQPVIICRKDDHAIRALDDLAGQTVAIEKDFAAREYLKDLPGVSFLDYVGTKEALEAVSLGKANAYVGSLISSTYIIDREAMSNLEVRSASGLPISDIRFAVNTNEPELARILDHGIASITEAEHDALRKRWIGVAGLGIDWNAVLRVAIPIVGALISVILVILIWNQRLHRQVARRRAAEEALSRQMSLQLALLENLPALVAYKDTDARFVGCNRAYEEAFGVTRHQLLGKTTLDIAGFPDEQRERGYSQDLEALRTGQPLHCEEQLVFVDGEVRDVLLWRIPFDLSDGTPAGLLSITVDVSRQKAAERALADQLAYQHALINTIPSPIWIKDSEARFIGCNRAYEEAFGTTREAIVGKTALEVSFFDPSRREADHRRDLGLLRTRERFFREEPFDLADGEPHDMLYWVHSFDLADGRVGGLVGALVDITESKALERQARDAERRLREITNSVPGVVYQLRSDPSGHREYTFMSDGVGAIGGVSRDEAMENPRLLWSLVLDDDKPALRQAIEHSTATGMPMNHEFRIRAADGTIKWVQSAADVQCASDGSTIFNGYWIDVTRRREIEQQAQVAEQRLRETTDNIPGAVYQIRVAPDQPLAYTFVSEGIRALRGLSQEQVLADFDACMGQVLDEDLPGLEAAIRKAVSELAPAEHEYRIRTPDDTVKWLRSAAVPSRKTDGSIVLNGFSVDVTAQKEAARALAEAERRLREMANSVPGVVYQLRIGADGARSYTFMSDAVTSLRGIGREEALADYRLLFRQVVEEDRLVIDRAIAKSVATLTPMTEEFRIRMPDGSIKWLQSGAVPTRTDDGAVILNGYWFDVTQHREMESELAEARAAADAANRAKSSFLAAMSHEIRTPMNGVLGMLELLSLTRLDAEQRANLDVVRDSGRSLLRIVDDILDFSKIEAGMLELRPEPTSLAQIVAGVRDVYSGAASAKRLVLAADVDPRISPAAMVDPLRLRQVLNNFVSNALKFTSEGSVTIGAELADSEDGIDTVCFAVTDTGIGISPENQKKLFQPFVQAESDTTRRFGGTGLGLVICRRIADLMGGAIEIESAVGRGTTMRLVVRLPQADPSQVGTAEQGKTSPAPTLDARRPAPDAETAAAEGTLVLVADDHPTNRLLIKRQINLLGYAAETVENGVEALAAWRRGRFGLVITDCHMPEMDGYALARAIRDAEKLNGGHHIPILACTANVLEGEAEACLAAGMDGYLAKPVELTALVKALDRWLPLSEGAGAPTPTKPATVPAPANGSDDAPIDREKLAELSLGDEAFEREMLADFRETADEDVKLLAAALADGDCGAVTRIAHRIKGASRTVGATSLAAISERMERAGRTNDHAGLAAAQEPLLREVERLRRYLEIT